MYNEIWSWKGKRDQSAWCCLTVNDNVIYHLLQSSSSLYFSSVVYLFALNDSKKEGDHFHAELWRNGLMETYCIFCEIQTVFLNVTEVNYNHHNIKLQPP